MGCRFKYQRPWLVDILRDSGIAGNTACGSGFSDNCNNGSCDASSSCSTGTYALRCQSGTSACSYTVNSTCYTGSSVTVSPSCKEGSSGLWPC